MKHFFSLLFCAAVLLLLCACEKKQNIAVPTPTPVPAPQIMSVKYYDRNGRPQREEIWEYDTVGQGKIGATVNYSYNDTGKPVSVKKTAAGDDYARMMENYVYSGDNWIQHVLYDSLGAAAESYTRTYYPKGALKTERKVTAFREGVNLSGTDETFAYDESGVLLRKDSVSGDIYTRTEYIYNDAGVLTGEDIYNSNTGKNKDYMLFNTVRYEHDAEGKLTKCTETGLNGNIVAVSVYTYDENGKVTYIAKYSDAEMTEAAFISSKIFEYDESGRCTLKADMNTDGSGWKTSYEYDEDGNIIYEAELTFFGESETRSRSVETEYDGNANPVKQVEKNYDGIITVRTWSYEYYDTGYVKTETRYADA